MVFSPETHVSDTFAPAARATLSTVVRAARTHRRKILAVGGTAAVALIIGLNYHLVAASMSAASSASPFWLGAALVCALLTIPAAAMCTVGASGRELCLARTSAVELAGNFVNRVAPVGIGRAMLSVKYLTRHGLTAERAVSTVAIGSVAGVIAHITATVGAWSLARNEGAKLPHLFNPQSILVMGAVLAFATLAVSVLMRRKPELASSTKQRGRDLVSDVARLRNDRRSTARLIIGALAVRLMFVACFMASLRAAGIVVHPAVAALAFLAGSALADVAPTPGGLGAAEVALAASVVAVGVQPPLAFAGVLIYRLATYWMLSVAGYVTWLSIRRRGIVA